MKIQQEITKEQIFAAIEQGPVSKKQFVKNKSLKINQKFSQIIKSLTDEGLIKTVRIEAFTHYVLKNWRMTDEMRLDILVGKCKKGKDGCLEWTGYVDKKRGPLTRLGKTGSPTSARRVVFRIRRRAAIGKYQCVKMDCENPLCIAYEHMRLENRNDYAKGKSLSPALKMKIAKTKQEKHGLITMDQAREIRVSDERARLLSEKYGISPTQINAIRRGEVWRDDYGMFSGLIRNENRSAA